MTMCSFLSCCWNMVFAMTSALSWQNSISFCPASFCTPRPNLPVTPGISWLPTLHSSPWDSPGKSTRVRCHCLLHKRNAVALIVNKRLQNAVLGCNLKNDRMISVGFQGKPFNIAVIQVYAPTSNPEEA